MSAGFMRFWVWVGILSAGGTIVLTTNRIFPHSGGLVFLFGALYLIAGVVMDSAIKSYSRSDRVYFTQRYGKWFPLLMGICGPFFLIWEFFYYGLRYHDGP